MTATEKQPGLIRRFFNSLLNGLDLFRRVVVNLFFIGMLLFLASSLLGRKPVVVPEGAALVIAPSGQIVEEYEASPAEVAMSRLLGNEEAQTRLRDLLSGIRGATEDKRIGALVINLDGLGGISPAQISEFDRALAEFRATERPVYVWSLNYDQKHYQLAARATEIWVDPLGGVLLEGYGVHNGYFRDALEKLALDVHVFRVGKYKSAVEPFLRDDMSPEARVANQQWLNELWAVARATMADGRGIEEDRFDSYIAELPERLEAVNGDAAAMAQASGLIDRIGNFQEFEASVIDAVGAAEGDDEDGFLAISLDDYRLALGEERVAAEAAESKAESASDSKVSSAKEIAVLVLQGMMVDGSQESDVIDSVVVNEQLVALRKDDDVAALVLRIDSPGGGIYTAENIRRELQRFKASGKPVVVSMGAVAASGGYWISADADSILAESNTITGSIGVFGVIPSMQRALAKLGIHNDGVGTSEIAAWSPTRALPEPLARSIQSSVEHGYSKFIDVVANGRELSKEQVEPIAGGRVWSGVQAQELGLVDVLGGQQQAIEAAASLAELEAGDYRVTYPSTAMSHLEQFFVDFSQRQRGRLSALNRTFGLNELTLWRELKQTIDVHQLLNLKADPRGLYAWCACEAK